MPTVVRSNLFALARKRESETGRRLTNRDISKGTGISEHTIGRWMKGEVTQVNTQVVGELCEFFGCEIGDLLYVERTPAGKSA